MPTFVIIRSYLDAPFLIKHFASGSDIDPARISPVLERIKSDTWQSDLFRLASLTWAVPVSNGFGCKLRYLVWDEHNKKLIGLIAIWVNNWSGATNARNNFAVLKHPSLPIFRVGEHPI